MLNYFEIHFALIKYMLGISEKNPSEMLEKIRFLNTLQMKQL